MIKRILSVFIVIILLVCTFSACSKEEEINIIYPIYSDPECLDPQIAETEAAILITRNCMEGLVRLGENGKILPGVADSWKISPDGKTYIFHIRENAKWKQLNSHVEVVGDGVDKNNFNYKVTADDCAFGLIRAIRKETKAKNAYLLFCIKNAMKVNAGLMNESELGIRASGDTLTITLERANPDFIRILTYPMCMPCSREFFEATGARYGLDVKYTLCNGPFYVALWYKDSSLTFYSSDDYRGDKKTSVSAMYFYVNNDDEQIIKKFNQGDYNTIPVAPALADKVDDSKDIIKGTQKNVVSGLAFNSSDINLANENIRKALVSAIDTGNLDEKTEYAGGVVPDSCRWAGKSYRACAGSVSQPQFNASNAVNLFKSGLEEAGLKKVDLEIFCTAEQRKDMIKIIQNWQKLFGFSINVTTVVKTREEIDEAVANGEYQIAVSTIQANDGSPIKFLEKFCTDNEENVFSFSNESYDLLINKCLHVYEGEQILSGLKAAERFLITDGVFYPLYISETFFVYRDELKNAYPVANVFDIDFTARVNKNAE